MKDPYSLPTNELETRNLGAHSFLRRIYSDEALSIGVRMRAASIAIAYESPKLIATAVVNEGSFAELLDKRLKRYEEMHRSGLIEAKSSYAEVTKLSKGPSLIEHSEITSTNGNGGSTNGGSIEGTEVAEVISPAPSPAPLRRLYNVKHYRRL
jgi:hypothetical protein